MLYIYILSLVRLMNICEAERKTQKKNFLRLLKKERKWTKKKEKFSFRFVRPIQRAQHKSILMCFDWILWKENNNNNKKPHFAICDSIFSKRNTFIVQTPQFLSELSCLSRFFILRFCGLWIDKRKTNIFLPTTTQKSRYK